MLFYDNKKPIVSIFRELGFFIFQLACAFPLLYWLASRFFGFSYSVNQMLGLSLVLLAVPMLFIVVSAGIDVLKSIRAALSLSRQSLKYDTANTIAVKESCITTIAASENPQTKQMLSIESGINAESVGLLKMMFVTKDDLHEAFYKWITIIILGIGTAAAWVKYG